jgi:hypothetical protein
MGSVYLLTLRQLSGRWRLLIMTALATLPVLMAVITLRDDDAPTVAEFEAVVFSAMLAGSILPLVVLAIAGAAFSNEIEDRTIANLTLAPIARWKIAVPKLPQVAGHDHAGCAVHRGKRVPHRARRIPRRHQGDHCDRGGVARRRGAVCVSVCLARPRQYAGDRAGPAVHRGVGRPVLRFRIRRQAAEHPSFLDRPDARAGCATICRIKPPRPRTGDGGLRNRLFRISLDVSATTADDGYTVTAVTGD